MYYCDKCGYLGEHGPEHRTPEASSLGVCGYKAAPLPAWAPATLAVALAPLRERLPAGVTLCLFIERGAVWVKPVGAHGQPFVLGDERGHYLLRMMDGAIRGTLGAA